MHNDITHRNDGLAFETALKTARYLARRGGAVPVSIQGHALIVTGDDSALAEISTLASELHGFRCELSVATLTIDVARCSSNDTSEERERLIVQLGETAARETDPGEDADRAYEEEARWCSTCTLHFLRRRARA